MKKEIEKLAKKAEENGALIYKNKLLLRLKDENRTEFSLREVVELIHSTKVIDLRSI